MNDQEMDGSFSEEEFDVVVSKVSVEYLDSEQPHWQPIVRVILHGNITVSF